MYDLAYGIQGTNTKLVGVSKFTAINRLKEHSYNLHLY